MGERWLPVVGFEGLYEVSNLGRVRSKHFSPPRVSRQGTDSNGYPIVMLSKDGKRRPFTVHRLVCRAFHGEPFAIWNEAAHLDGNRANASADNLRWVNKAENHHHKKLHGTHQAGEKHPRAKLTEAAVQRIRTRYASSKVIAREYGVSRHAVFDIWQGKRWTGSVHEGAGPQDIAQEDVPSSDMGKGE